MAFAAIVGMAVAGTWLWIPNRDPLVWEFTEKVRPLLWGAFLAAILAGASATYFLTVTASHRKKNKTLLAPLQVKASFFVDHKSTGNST